MHFTVNAQQQRGAARSNKLTNMTYLHIFFSVPYRSLFSTRSKELGVQLVNRKYVYPKFNFRCVNIGELERVALSYGLTENLEGEFVESCYIKSKQIIERLVCKASVYLFILLCFT